MLTLKQAIAAVGVKLHGRGHKLTAECPFHDDDGRHLEVDVPEDAWSCSVCNDAGGLMLWVQRVEGVSTTHAQTLLTSGAKLTGAALQRNRHGELVKKSTRRFLETPFDADADDSTLLEQVAEHYANAAKDNADVAKFAAARGIRLDTIEAFGVGISNRTLGYRLPPANRKLGATLRARLTELGVLKASGHEALHGSLVVPLRNKAGKVVALYGRKMGRGLRKGVPLHVVVGDPTDAVFNAAGMKRQGHVVVVEGLIDALSLHSKGVKNVTATLGEPVGERLRDCVQRAKVPRVLLGFDRDPAGAKLTKESASVLEDAGLEVFQLVWPHGTDPNDFVVTAGDDAPDALEDLIRNAQWCGRGTPPEQPLKPTPVVPTTLELVPNPQPESDTNNAEPKRKTTSLPPPLPPPPPPMPAPPEPNPGTDTFEFQFEDRYWRVEGLDSNETLQRLRLKVFTQREDIGWHVDVVDMYVSRQRDTFAKEASAELGLPAEILKKDLGHVLLAMENEREVRRAAAKGKLPEPELAPEEKEEALALLKRPDLLDRIARDFERCGLVGERTNLLATYLVATSRLMTSPLGAVIQSSSASGKTSLMRAVLDFFPENSRREYSSITGQAMYYAAADTFKNKILAVAEEEGASRASYSLKLLQSEGRISIASTGADKRTGKLAATEYVVEGPVALVMTTTSSEVDPELLNRCLVLGVDEGRAQTQAIQERQRHAQTLEGVIDARTSDPIKTRHRNAQRLLKPMVVVNPYAPKLRFADHGPRTRRDHRKFLDLIKAVALLRQYQKEIKKVEERGIELEYIEVDPGDIAVATRIAREVLGRSLDELPSQTRRVLEDLETIVVDAAARKGQKRTEFRFTRREAREALAIGNTQLGIHLGRLVEHEMVVLHRGGRGTQMVYELPEGSVGTGKRLPGLLDLDALGINYDDQADSLAGTCRPAIGHLSGGVRNPKNDESGLPSPDNSANSSKANVPRHERGVPPRASDNPSTNSKDQP